MLSTETIKKRKMYTCKKCAKIFKQKSHFDDHSNRKNDCSKSTDLSRLIEEKIEEMKSEKINVRVTLQSGEDFFIDVMSNTGIQSLYEELIHVLPLSYLNLNQEWFKFKRLLTHEDIAAGHREYDFYRMRNGEHLVLSEEHPGREHLVDTRTFLMGGLIGGLMPEYKNMDKEFVTHYGYYYQITNESIKNNNAEEKDEKKSTVIVLFQKTNLFPSVSYPPVFELGKNVDYKKLYQPINQFLAYACDLPDRNSNLGLGKACFNPFKWCYEQSLEWSSSAEDALKNINFYDDSFLTRLVVKRYRKKDYKEYIEKKIILTSDAIETISHLYRKHYIYGKL